MIEKFLRGEHRRLQLYHVRMAFSRDMTEVFRFKLSKVFVLLQVIAKILYLRVRFSIPVLYFPVSPPEKLAMYRDLIILLSVRWCFRHTVFHFHAGGISELYDSLSVPVRILFRSAYYGADAAIRMSDLSPPDGQRLRAKREFIIPNGIEDHRGDSVSLDIRLTKPPHILFTGVLRKSKGVGVLLEACKILRDRSIDFRLDLMGLASGPYKEQLVAMMKLYSLEQYVTFLGELTGEEKWRAFQQASIFCFPSFFEGEGMPIAILEAMQFALPVVATQWRGIPALVRDRETGHLVPIGDSIALADKVALLISDPASMRRMGERGRQVFLEEFQLVQHCQRMERALLLTAGVANEASLSCSHAGGE